MGSRKFVASFQALSDAAEEPVSDVHIDHMYHLFFVFDGSVWAIYLIMRGACVGLRHSTSKY